ncbi:MAG: hypothetical protein VR67_18440 [Peptococcaceae bacterium BRH_c8a]|nr:MAG: hypothetical protein VR67_18440 [Peptococcaceae bacterium BRH_c8a]
MLDFEIGKYLERLLMRVTPLKKEPPGLVEAANNAKRTWKQALDYLNYIDNTFVDYAVHNINASERRYMALVQQARKEGLTAWSDSLSKTALPANEICERDGQANPQN